MGTMQRIGQQLHDAFELDDIANRFHPRLLIIVDGAYGSMQYFQCFDHMVVGDFDFFNHNPPTLQNIPFQNPVGHVSTQGGPSFSRNRRYKHGLQDEVIREMSVQNTEAGTQSRHSPIGNQFTRFVPLTIADAYAMPPIQLLAFGPQVTPSPHSPHIGLDATLSPQFQSFGTYPAPSPHFPVFGVQFPSSSHMPPFGYAVIASASSSAPKLHPIFTFLSRTGGTSPILDLPDYYSLGQPMAVPTSIQPVSTIAYNQSGDFITYRSQSNYYSSTTAKSVDEEDIGLDAASIDFAPPIDAPQEPIVLHERCRRQFKRFCCPPTTPGDKGKGKRRTGH